MVKNPLPVQETQGLGLIPGPEDPIEEEMATHSSILAWKTPWTEEPHRPQSMGSQSQTQMRACTHTHTSMTRGPASIAVGPILFFNAAALQSSLLCPGHTQPDVSGVQSRGRGAVPGQGCSPRGGVQSRGRGAVPGEGWGRITAASVAGSCPLNPVVRFHMLLISLDKHTSVADQPLFSDG